MSASALFDHDRSEPQGGGQGGTDELEEIHQGQGRKCGDIDVIGHTDSDGSEEYNMGLSIRRAESVREYMVSEGVDASNIDVSGEGESNPIASNATKEGRAENRRVDIHVGINPAN